MENVPQETAGLISAAGLSLLEHGLLGSLLLLSLAGNAALIWALVRCYRFNRGADRHDDYA